MRDHRLFLIVFFACFAALLALRNFLERSGRVPLEDLPREALLAALAVDLNTADVGTLSAVQGLGPRRAETIVEDRLRNGLFENVDDLERVRGIGRATVDEVRVLVSASARPTAVPTARPTAVPGCRSEAVGFRRGASRRRIDINTASVAELESLPSVGPAIASRIVAQRERDGPFIAVADLVRVDGIGPKTLEKLEPMVLVRSGGGP